MAYDIELRPRARKAFRRLSREAQLQVQTVIDQLATQPRPTGCKNLQGHSDLLRIRTGNYRVIYQIQDERLVIIVIDIGHRQGIYRDL